MASPGVKPLGSLDIDEWASIMVSATLFLPVYPHALHDGLLG
jgi:hypothetical protein